jgi:restriction system protein
VKETDRTFWGIHVVGAAGDAIYLKQNHVAIGWPEAGDLAQVKSDRESFKQKVEQTYQGQKRGWVINSASQLFRFVHEMQKGDFVIYRSKYDHKIHIGEISGSYKFDSALSAEYPNARPVKWLGEFPITRFTQGALYEVGSALTLFQVKNYIQEYRAAVSGEERSEPDAADETVALVANEIEQTTEDFVLKQLAKETKGYPFQAFVADLLRTMGYRTQESAKGTDEGIDIVAHKDELKLEPPIVKVQVKSTEGSVGGPDVRALYGNVGHGEVGLLITLGTFSRQAEDFAKGKSNLRLIDGTELVNFVLRHYEDLDPRFKAILPLKRVYIPSPAPAEDSIA